MIQRACAAATGLLIALYAFIDLALRPPFIAVNIDSEASSHAVPAIVSVLHLANNLLLAVPAILMAFATRTDFRRSGAFLGIGAAIVAVAALGLMLQSDAKPIAYVGILLLTFTAATLFQATPEGRTASFRTFMAALAIGCGIVLALAVLRGEYNWGRLASRAGPTYWGMMAVMCVAGSVCVRPLWLRVPLVLVALAVLLLASARGAMLATLTGGLVLLLVTIARSRPDRRRPYIMLAILGLALVPLVVPFAADKLLDISDPHRGIGSGATGRAFAWAEAWQLFLHHPVLGVGYRRHEQFITVATSAHNGYLAVMAELGAVGFALYLVLMLGAAARAVRDAVRTDDPGATAAAMFLCSYLTIGFTENLALGTGLPMPLAMIFVAGRAWSRAPASPLLLGYRAPVPDRPVAMPRARPRRRTPDESPA